MQTVTARCDFVTVIGQSLAVLYPPSAAAPVLAPGQGIYWDGSAWQDLCQNGVSMGGFHAAYAQVWFESCGRTVAFVPAAVGGMGLVPVADDGGQNWSAGGVLVVASLAMRTAALAALSGISSPLTYELIIDQGQRDGYNINAGFITQQQYRDGLVALRQYIRDQTGRAGFYISRCGTDPMQPDAGYAAIRQVHDAACSPADINTFCIFDEAVYFGPYGMADPASPLHPTQAGYNLMGATAASRIRRVFAPMGL